MENAGKNIRVHYHLRCFHFDMNKKVIQTHTCGRSDGVGAGDEGFAVVEADENIHGPVKTRVELVSHNYIQYVDCIDIKSRTNMRLITLSSRHLTLIYQRIH